MTMPSRPRVLIARRIFPEIVARLACKVTP
jgi:hypothetical protein